ncbi:MAG: anti-sigma factor [Tepidiformaceae bacterium]
MTEQDEHPVDLLPELALGVLDENEAAELRAHLATCASCRAEHEELLRVTKFLPFAAEDREPAATTKAAVMERIATEPRPGAARSRVIRPHWPMFGGAIAAGLLLLTLGGFGGWLFGSDDDSGLDEQVVRQQVVIDAAANGTLRTSRGTVGDAEATLLTVPGSSDAFVAISNAPGLEPGKRYQAWFFRGATPEPGEVFADASGVWLRSSGGPLDEYNAVAFTIEDEAGAAQPTQDPFMVIPVEASARAR